MKGKHITALRVVVAAAAAAMIWIGVSRGEAAIVLQKAVFVCLECIGLG